MESAALKGQDKNQIEVTGDGVDAVALISLLRSKVGFAELVSVSAVGEQKDDKKDGGDGKKNDPTPQVPVYWCYPPMPMHYMEYGDRYGGGCPIL